MNLIKRAKSALTSFTNLFSHQNNVDELMAEIKQEAHLEQIERLEQMKRDLTLAYTRAMAKNKWEEQDFEYDGEGYIPTQAYRKSMKDLKEELRLIELFNNRCFE